MNVCRDICNVVLSVIGHCETPVHPAVGQAQCVLPGAEGIVESSCPCQGVC